MGVSVSTMYYPNLNFGQHAVLPEYQKWLWEIETTLIQDEQGSGWIGGTMVLTDPRMSEFFYTYSPITSNKVLSGSTVQEIQYSVGVGGEGLRSGNGGVSVGTEISTEEVSLVILLRTVYNHRVIYTQWIYL